MTCSCSPRVRDDPIGHLQARLRNGLEDDISLVVAKSVLGLLDAGVAASDIVRTGVEFGTRYRSSGWGAGLTVLVAMANLLPHLAPDDQALALVHGLTFVARDTHNHAPRFAVGPLETQAVPLDRLGAWYRRFVDTRSSDAAERTLETALTEPDRLADVEAMMFAAVTDHVFIDGGHTIDFTNKAFEAVEHVGKDAAGEILPTLVRQTTAASRSEEFGEWRHPHNHVALAQQTIAALDGALAEGRACRGDYRDVGPLGWQLLDDDPEDRGRRVPRRVTSRSRRRTSRSRDRVRRGVAHRPFPHTERSRRLGYGPPRVHGSQRVAPGAPTSPLNRTAARRGAHGVARQSRPFPQRAGRAPPHASTGTLEALAHCFDVQGMVDEAGNEAYGFLQGGGTRAELVAALGHALLAEDAEFHWYQVLEAGVRQSQQWSEGSEETAMVLTAVTRFVSAHTPTRRELPTVVRIATRLRRGEALYEDDPAMSTP